MTNELRQAISDLAASIAADPAVSTATQSSAQAVIDRIDHEVREDRDYAEHGIAL
ncbi:hypothetical protein [Rhodococcus globerulus]|uniref:hypothetical protein n=1 Tax=Rhodococcus globerulus TaxID=33008 RepID=UPI001F19956C|nr:hypothetical protein [Rhodococcus globerulus]MCE4268209.1 hypothetical protein [Rhodococcus globerulus]